MATLDEVQAAIEAHRRAVAAHELAHEVREMAAHRLCAMRPSNNNDAVALFEYLATLGNELEPGIAQMADLCLGRLADHMCLAERKVVKGPDRWWPKAVAVPDME
jgi:hypothetical protein